MNDVARRLLFASLVLVPLVVAPGWEYPFDVPKVVAITVLAGVIVTAAIPSLPTWWAAAPRSSRVTLAASASFAAWVAVSASLSDAPALSLLGQEARFVGAAVIVSAATFVLAPVGLLTTPRDIDRGVYALMASVLLVAAYTVVQALGLDPAPWAPGRGRPPVATLGNPNFVGAFVSLGAPHVCFLWSRDKRSRPAAVVLGLLVTAALYTADALLGWVAAASGAVAFTLVMAPTDRRRFQAAVGGATPLLAPVGGLLIVAIGAFGSYRTAEARIAYWAAAVPMWTDNPVVGVGIGRLAAFHPQYRPPGSVIEFGLELSVDSTHAWLLDVAASLGTVGLIIQLLVLAACGLVVHRNLLDASRVDRARIAVLVGLLCSHGVQASISVPTVSTVWVGWVLVGLVLALDGARRNVAGRGMAGRRDRRPLELAFPIAAVVLAGLLLIPGLQLLATSRDLARSADLRATNQPALAKPFALQVVERSPWWPATWFELASVEADLSDVAASRLAVLGVLDADPRRVDAMRTVASAEAALRRPDEAELWYLSAMELDPYGSLLHRDVAVWALNNGRIELAQQGIEVLEQVVPPGAQIHDEVQGLREELDQRG